MVMHELRLQFLDSELETQPLIEMGIAVFMDSSEATVVKNKFGFRTTWLGSFAITLNRALVSDSLNTTIGS
jgi:hypothetical protein